MSIAQAWNSAAQCQHFVLLYFDHILQTEYFPAHIYIFPGFWNVTGKLCEQILISKILEIKQKWGFSLIYLRVSFNH